MEGLVQPCCTSRSPRVLKGQNWLKACMHCLSCNDPACTFSACRDVKQLLWHIFSSSSTTCAEAAAQASQQSPSSTCRGGLACSAVRSLLGHWIKCQDYHCEMCPDLWADIGMRRVPGGRSPCGSPSMGQSMDSSMTEGMSSGACSPALISGVNSQDTNAVPSSSHQSCSTTMDVQSEISGGQGAGLQGPPCKSFSPATGLAHNLEQHHHTQVIYFLELLLQCFVQKAPSNKFTQVQADWLPRGKQLWRHLLSECPSSGASCAYPGCQNARAVLRHRVTCQAPQCAICTPVKQFFQRQPAAKATVPDMQDLADAILKLSL